MPSKQDATVKNVEQAISSLYSLFPSYSGCHRVRTPEVVAIEKKINARKEELDKDAKMLALKAQLAAKKKEIMTASNAARRQVDDLMRRFRLRGVTEQLICDVEKLSKQKPIVEVDHCE